MRALSIDVGELVFALLHEPRAARSGLGVILVPPFGWDEYCSYRPRLAWADALADDGHVALRLDLPATGDSGGSPRDPARLDAWTAAVGAAARRLRSEPEVEAVAAIGLGVGGLVAHRAVAEGAPIDALVSWTVPARGRALVRELQAFGRLEADEGGPDAPPLAEGEVHAGGFTLTAETAAALSAVDLRELDGPRPQRALLLGRDGIDPDAGLAEDLEAHGCDVQVDRGVGWGRMVDHPQRSELPAGPVARVGAWLQEMAPAAAGTVVPPAAGGPDHETLVLGPVRETVLRPGDPGDRPFAVLAEPAAGVAPDAPFTAVWLNPGALRRSGPNRMWTEISRRWAARGIPVLRVDVRGIGDAEGEGEYADEAGLYDPALTVQVATVLDHAAGLGLPDRFVVGGMCSGAYWAFHAALEDPRIREVVAVNPRLFLWDDWAGASRDWRRAVGALHPGRWREIAAAERPVARAVALVPYFAAAPRRAAARRRATREAMTAGGDALDLALGRLRAQGQHLSMLFSGREPLHEELVMHGRLDRMLASDGISFTPLPGFSHTLKPQHVQREAHAAIDRVLGSALERTREAARS